MPQMEWISVKDRLPEIEGRYLIFGGWPEIGTWGIHTYKNHPKPSRSWEDSHFDPINPTHWMPLPQPPKGE